MLWTNGSRAVARIWYEAWFKRILCSFGNQWNVGSSYLSIVIFIFVRVSIWYKRSLSFVSWTGTCVLVEFSSPLKTSTWLVSFSDNDDVICCFVFTERLGGCLYKCGCVVKFSILMSRMRKNSFSKSLRACTPTPSFFLHRLQYVWSAFSTILPHLVKSILDGSLYLGPFLKNDRNSLSGIQARQGRPWQHGPQMNTEMASPHMSKKIEYRTPNIRISIYININSVFNFTVSQLLTSASIYYFTVSQRLTSRTIQHFTVSKSLTQASIQHFGMWASVSRKNQLNIFTMSMWGSFSFHQLIN